MKEPSKIIDIHCHTFNLKYLPVAGVLTAYTKNILPIKVAMAAEHILILLTKSSRLKTLRKTGLLDDDSKTFVEDLLELSEEEVIKDIAMKATFENHLFDDELLQEAFAMIDVGDDENKTMSFAETYELKRYDDQEFEKFIFPLFRKLLNVVLTGFHYLKWFRFMMRSEKSIYKYLLKHNKGVENYIFHMMDTYKCFQFKNGTYSESKLKIASQINKMKGLVLHSKNNLQGFVAFNPHRDNGLKIVQDALKFDGFIGIKFYPPLNYKAIGNDDDVIETRVHALFTWCIEEDIPVFTHCTSTGFESIPGKSGKNANPSIWKQLLDKNEFKDLRLCLGHAGGEDGWKTPFDETINDGQLSDYAKGVYELCISKKNVYCEVGFLSHIYNKKERNNFKKRLLYLLKDENADQYKFRDKFCYGSDYHILFNEGLERSYLKKFKKIFSHDDFEPYREAFFHENATSFLNQ